MATTISLNSLDTVWCTTYYGGPGRGTCFDFSMQLDAETQVTRTLNVEEFLTVLRTNGSVRGLAKPCFENGHNRNDVSIEDSKVVGSMTKLPSQYNKE